MNNYHVKVKILNFRILLGIRCIYIIFTQIITSKTKRKHYVTKSWTIQAVKFNTAKKSMLTYAYQSLLRQEL